MKILLITALTSVLLSSNSFADTTSDIKSAASMMAKDGLRRVNMQLATHLQSSTQVSFNVTSMSMNGKTQVLLAKAENTKHQIKSAVQAADE
jgi:uncharacterized membrane protein